MAETRFKLTIIDTLLLSFLRSFRRALGLLPLDTRSKLAYRAGYLLSYLSRRDMRIATTQIEFALGDRYPSKSARTQLARQSFAETAQATAEFAYIESFINNVQSELSPGLAADIPVILDDEGHARLREHARRNENVILIGGHYGNFEIHASHFINQLGLDLYAAASDPHSPALAQFLGERREAYGLKVMWRKDANTPRYWLKAMKSGASMAFLVDQDSNLNNIFAPFYGLDAASPVAPLKLAVRAKLPIYSCFLDRLAPLRYQAVVEEIEYNPDSADAPLELLKSFNKRLEARLEQYPEQWVWWHRRWRRRPGEDYSPGSGTRVPSTDEYLNWLEGKIRDRKNNRPDGDTKFPASASESL